ncbi:putative quinol monooxygenase [Streptomyces calidiresistens]
MPLYVVARWTARTETQEEVAEVLSELSEASRAEPGCLMYRPVRSTDDPRRFVLLECYADEAALARHQESRHYRELVPGRAVPLLAEREVARYREA